MCACAWQQQQQQQQNDAAEASSFTISPAGMKHAGLQTTLVVLQLQLKCLTAAAKICQQRSMLLLYSCQQVLTGQ
jgi:hypothetical protein